VSSKHRHPDKDIREAVGYAESEGWVVRVASGHAWGILRCPWNDPACWCGLYCQVSVWKTPRSPTDHAKQIRRVVDRCVNIQRRRSRTRNGASDEDL
jgi:hypothetical protein